MPDATLEEILQNQNIFINQRTEEINSLKEKVNEALDNFNTLANREYAYAHEPFVVKDLETDYNTIVSKRTAFPYYSAIGIRAELKNGDTVFKQGMYLFINGVEVDGDYIFSGINSENGTEIVNIWYFEKESRLALNQECGFNIVETRILNKLSPIEIDDSYYLYADELFLDGYTTALKPTARKLTIKNQAELSQQIPDYAVCVESDAISLSTLNTQIAAKDTLKYLSLPELKQTAYSTGMLPAFGKNAFDAATMSKFNVIIDFPKLKKIFDVTDIKRSTFNGIKMVILPESVEEIGLYCFCNNETVILNCKNATKIHDKWCSLAGIDVKSAPTNFVMCEDWGASINISIAAMNWKAEDYINLFENKLRNMGSETRNITIPSAMLISLQNDPDGSAAISVANGKGWTVGGA